MTIRKRLFWSNIMMLTIPAVLSAVMAYMVLFVFTRYSNEPLERVFPHAFQTVVNFQQSGDLETLYQNIDTFNETVDDGLFYMAVIFQDNSTYPPELGQIVKERGGLLGEMIAEGGSGSYVVDSRRYVLETMDEYRLLFVDERGQVSAWEQRKPLLLHLPLLFLILIGIVLTTNRVLTMMVTKKIMRPLNLLAAGARQIGEGNLSHRIQYGGKDEFVPVCADFNEMAGHLQTLIEYQRRNEASRKELLAGISHDLRTPLTSIKAYVEGLLDGVAEDYSAQLRYLSIIRNKAEDIDRLVDKLFIFSKLDIGEYPVNLERVDLGQELEAMVAVYREDYRGKGLSVELEPVPPGILVETDLVGLHNVIQNILDNSLRYKVREECRVRIECELRPASVRLRITDDGPGVREEELDKLFDVFYRSDPSRQNPNKGSGLGLAISARMMERIGGSIRAENAQEGGLRMVLELPCSPREEEPNEAHSDH